VFIYFQEDGHWNDGWQSQSPYNRKLVVNGTRHPVAIYQLNGEHGKSTAYSEFVDTDGVQVFGCKSEGAGAVIFVVRSTNFASYGHGGAANTRDESSLDPASCDGMAPCPWQPGLYRIVQSDNVRFVNLQGQFESKKSVAAFEVYGSRNFSSVGGQWPSIWFRTAS
jgi:hypothetical protein